jgi:alpha-N-acetylgalactosaminidase
MTYAEWGVDMVKVDGCYANETVFAEGYPAMGKALNATGRPIVYSCSWPAYLKDPDYATISKTCNLWRNYDDIQDSLDSVLSIILHYAEGQDVFGRYAGPGQWNDPDQLIVGDFGLSLDQQMSQMAMWTIFASPLLMSNDLRNIPEDSREILQNPEVIAVNQDKLGVQGRLVSSSTTSHPHSPEETTLYVFAKPLSTGSVAVALLNTDDQGTPRNMTVSLQEAGLKVTSARVRDLFELKDIGVFNSKVTLSVNPSGGVRLLLLTPVSP